MKYLLTAIFAWLAAPGLLAAQDSRLESRFSGAFLAELHVEVDAAAAARLPTEPLIQKALEGASKGADDARILSAVRSLRERLEEASAVLGEEAGEATLLAGAGALYVGVTRTTLSDMKLAHQESPSLLLALVVLSDLIRRGVPENTASEVILSLARAGIDDRSVSWLRERVEEDIFRGASPEAAVSARALWVIRTGGLPPGGLPR